MINHSSISIFGVEGYRQEDAWIIVNGDALDVTKWIPIHPGGEQVPGIILSIAVFLRFLGVRFAAQTIINCRIWVKNTTMIFVRGDF